MAADGDKKGVWIDGWLDALECFEVHYACDHADVVAIVRKVCGSWVASYLHNVMMGKVALSHEIVLQDVRKKSWNAMAELARRKAEGLTMGCRSTPCGSQVGNAANVTRGIAWAVCC
ncbi:hypothetical protein, variant [Aphanomyces astaci]|uniref:Uncharacterized protein n=1 Tax=Aphanomyces astaci TaxID=112090 RepID=W4G9M7_APHAT|nr:hypothetical protein H257_09409 [Aphanomyces astaci]XP_009833920.1 hypothetical protein, variant [Aphanomyces astaci]ETV76374.1 hypothetical protein H257_09409 [Aphanomyces astaci]ETV76375.1 hypothetical protein, variant [Aphanomyces astaci]|eukprot:XP_009833919.1 hypothetical protein H257_09409 [Aphanomyces astaci]